MTTDEGDILRSLWALCKSPVYRVMVAMPVDGREEEICNMSNAQMRHLSKDYYLYVDDVDGFSIEEFDLDSLTLEPVEEEEGA